MQLNSKQIKKFLKEWLKNLFLIAILLTFSTCKTSQKTVEQKKAITISKEGVTQLIKENETHTIETKIYVPTSASFTLENPCDSLGNLKDLNFKTKFGNVKAQVTSLNNQLQFNFSEIDSLKSVIESKTSKYIKLDSVNKLLEKELYTFKSVKATKVVWSKYTYIFLLSTIALAYLLLSKWRKLIPTFF